jgi:hypothetical protein
MYIILLKAEEHVAHTMTTSAFPEKRCIIVEYSDCSYRGSMEVGLGR